MHKKIKPTPASGCYLQFLSSADEFNLEEKIKKKRKKINQESSVNFIKISLRALVMRIMEIMAATLPSFTKTWFTLSFLISPIRKGGAPYLLLVTLLYVFYLTFIMNSNLTHFYSLWLKNLKWIVPVVIDIKDTRSSFRINVNGLCWRRNEKVQPYQWNWNVHRIEITCNC